MAWLLLFSVAGCAELTPTQVEKATPTLTDLVVTGAGVLTPNFTAGRRRFSVVSVTGTDTLSIAAWSEEGNRIYISGVEVNAGTPLSLVPTPGDSITIVVRTPLGATRAFQLLYLPTDFPQLTVTNLRPTPQETVTYLDLGPYAVAIDDAGVPLFYKREVGRVMDFKQHPSGEYSYAVPSGTQNSFGRVQKVIVVLDANFQEIDRVSTVGLNHTDDHEFLIRPNGNYVLMAYHDAIRDMTAFGGTTTQRVAESVLQEIDRSRHVVFQWSTWPEVPYDESMRRGVDYAHMNSIFVDEQGDILTSLRFPSQVVKISRSTGQVVWRLGGISSDFVFVEDPYDGFCGQHTARLTPTGTILLFDNGSPCTPGHDARGGLTRVVEYRLDLGAMTATRVWSYDLADGYSVSQGSAQRLRNGNTLIGWGNGPSVTETEVTAAGAKVWELRATVNGVPIQTYRAHRRD